MCIRDRTYGYVKWPAHYNFIRIPSKYSYFGRFVYGLDIEHYTSWIPYTPHTLKIKATPRHAKSNHFEFWEYLFGVVKPKYNSNYVPSYSTINWERVSYNIIDPGYIYPFAIIATILMCQYLFSTPHKISIEVDKARLGSIDWEALARRAERRAAEAQRSLEESRRRLEERREERRRWAAFLEESQRLLEERREGRRGWAAFLEESQRRFESRFRGES